MARPRRSTGRAKSSMSIPQTLNPANPKPITPPVSDTLPDAPAPLAAGTESLATADGANSTNDSGTDLTSPPMRSPSSSPTLNSSTSAPPSTQTPPSSASSKSPSPPPCIRFKPRAFRAPDGTVFEAWKAADRPDAPMLGEEPKRSSDGTIKPRTKRQAEDELEFQWQKKRKLTVVEKVFRRLESCVTSSKSDHEGIFHFEGEPLPDWLNAEREFQDDGSPGTYIVRPNKEDFENRFEQIISLLEPFGMKLGVIKLKIPEECIDKAPPVPVANTYVPPPAPPPMKKKRGRPPKPKTYADPRKSIVTETPGVPGSESTAAAPSTEPSPPTEPALQLPPDPLVYTMTQFLPLHVNSKHKYAPVYEVISKNQRLVPISQFPHNLSESARNLRIPEDAMLLRGRSWEDIKQGNPGGEVYYSSDNDVTPELRAHLGLQDPRLTKLPGNHIFDSTESVIGIHTPYLYLGNPYTMFALHQEDYCALSFNYHHKGAPKMWRVTCPLDYEKVERLVARIGDEAPGEKLCSQHVRHASLFVSQGAFELEGVRTMLVRQKMGEMIITWPLSYHEGWNEGANICEAIAYGSEMWRDTFVEEGDTLYRSCGRRCVQRGMGLPIQLKFKKGGDATTTTTKEDGN